MELLTNFTVFSKLSLDQGFPRAYPLQYHWSLSGLILDSAFVAAEKYCYHQFQREEEHDHCCLDWSCTASNGSVGGFYETDSIMHLKTRDVFLDLQIQLLKRDWWEWQRLSQKSETQIADFVGGGTTDLEILVPRLLHARAHSIQKRKLQKYYNDRW